MSRDPWAALQERRRQRHWRNWPWSWAALVLGLLMLVALGFAVLLAAGSMRMPGDGAAPRWQHVATTWCLAASGLLFLATATTTLLGWRLDRGRVPALLACLPLGAVLVLVGWVAWELI